MDSTNKGRNNGFCVMCYVLLANGWPEVPEMTVKEWNPP
jgi:hypothetical protein